MRVAPLITHFYFISPFSHPHAQVAKVAVLRYDILAAVPSMEKRYIAPGAFALDEFELQEQIIVFCANCGADQTKHIIKTPTGFGCLETSCVEFFPARYYYSNSGGVGRI